MRERRAFGALILEELPEFMENVGKHALKMDVDDSAPAPEARAHLAT